MLYRLPAADGKRTYRDGCKPHAYFLVRGENDPMLKAITDTTTNTMAELAKSQKFQLEKMTSEIGKLSESNETKLEAVRVTVESKLQSMQVDNANQLELMRQTVDEKLQGALLESAIDEYGEENDDMAADQLGLMPS